MYLPNKNRSYLTGPISSIVLTSFLLVFGLSASLQAQSLGWEGETGVFVTPLAYTANAEGKMTQPVVGYHYLNAGSVIGDFHEVSVTTGFARRFEVGYTHEIHSEGSDPALSPLWHNGFNIFHGKANLIPENFGKHQWIPAISAGFMVRSQVHNVGNAVAGKDKTNGDVYMVATKAITQVKPVTIILSGGARGTNAELWGMGGNAPKFCARGFAAIGIGFRGPWKSSITLASEVAQQPHHPEGFPTLNIPTTLTYAVRVFPNVKYKFNVDCGVAQIAGHTMPGVDLKARHQVGVQVSYGF